MQPESEFRKNPVKIARMREILDDPVMQEAIIMMRDGTTIADVDNDMMDGIASVRKLSRLAGAHEAVECLFKLTQPYQEPQSMPEETWGVEKL